ncbi:zinc finger protein 540 [Astyanax mexicanus]|uniref:zinc finger protein 540 n=1 Tax=Astyanax mexicanus TaxID=7994 RepID=UPI0020CB1F50|nr:zinc finger protein 540 [Astyanax mexicanus]
MMENSGMRNSHTEKLLEQPCHSQKYVDSVQVKTEDDTDPIWACYESLEKQGPSEAFGVKTEPLWVKSEAPEFEEANVTRCENIFSDQDRAVLSQTVGIKNEDHAWESFWDCYNSVPGSENQQTESDIKQEIVTIKQECYTASNLLLTLASQTISSPVVTLASKKDSKSIGDLQNETFTVSNPKSISCVNSVSSYKSPIIRHVLDSGSQIKDTNQHVARPPDKSQHIVQEKCTPQHISPSNTLSQSNLRPAHGANQPHSSSPEHEQAGENSVPQQGGVCLERSASQQEQPLLNCFQFYQQCQKTMRSHYVEGSKHKIPRSTKSEKQEIVTSKQECYAASNVLLAMASRAISSPVVTLASKKDSKSIGNLQNETFTVSNPKSTSCVNSVSSYKSPILRHGLDSGTQIKDTNQQVARPPDKSQHIVQKNPISPSNTLSQSNLRPAHGANQSISSSPEHEQAGENSAPQQGGVCLERSASQQKQPLLDCFQFCQQCQKTMRSHYVEGSKHKIPKTSKSKNKAQTRNWKCCQCDVALISSGHLIYHLMKKHARSRCVHCDMSFNSKKKLAYHIKCKHEPPASCEVCGKVFRSGHHLKVHQATHNKELIKHFCELCGKGFRLRSALQMHMNVHTEDKPYKCPDCKATFKAAFYLSRHRITHTDLKPFSCHVCQNKFRTKANLKVHLKTHDKDPLKEKGKRKRETRTQKKKQVQLSESEEEEWEEEEESEEQEESVEEDE